MSAQCCRYPWNRGWWNRKYEPFRPPSKITDGNDLEVPAIIQDGDEANRLVHIHGIEGVSENMEHLPGNSEIDLEQFPAVGYIDVDGDGKLFKE